MRDASDVRVLTGPLFTTEAALLTRLLAAAQRDYEEACDNWKTVESKAQATAAASGVFLGALFTAALKSSNGDVASVRSALVAAASFLCVSCLAAIRALWVRSYDPPHARDELRADAQPFVGSGSRLLSMQEAQWLSRELERFVKVASAVTETCNSKASALIWAQGAFGFALLVFAGAVFKLLLH